MHGYMNIKFNLYSCILLVIEIIMLADLTKEMSSGIKVIPNDSGAVFAD
jgi:hypothetical protein